MPKISLALCLRNMTEIPTIKTEKEDFEWYSTIGYISAFLTFFGVWIYAIGEWGFLIGIMAGWIPAFITAVIAGYTWPIVIFVLAWLLLTSL